VPHSPTWLLVKDELVGFAKSKVMIVLWVVLPVLTMLGYFLLPSGALIRGSLDNDMTATTFMALLQSSIAGTVAALMVAVDIVSEKNRKVYDLYVIRPIRRETIIIAKFLAVFACVTIACVASILLGISVDWIRFGAPTGGELYELLKALTMLSAVLALSAAVGVFFGVVVKTILVAVILILYVGQNIAIVPMLPMHFGILPGSFWLFMLISGVLAALILWGSAVLFRRTEL
jgi:ABC-type transport system involved in multi-copper enzyme maturation permease subunit